MIDAQFRKHGTGVRLLAWERAALEALAARERLTLSGVIRRAVVKEAQRSLIEAKAEVQVDGQNDYQQRAAHTATPPGSARRRSPFLNKGSRPEEE